MKFINMDKIILFVLMCFVFTGCNHRGSSKDSVQDGDFVIEFLFEKDGCKMYRFKDGRRYIYWANCSGRVSADFRKIVSNGKTNTVRKYDEETIITE